LPLLWDLATAIPDNFDLFPSGAELPSGNSQEAGQHLSKAAVGEKANVLTTDTSRRADIDRWWASLVEKHPQLLKEVAGELL
jgi:hypothetical protein